MSLSPANDLRVVLAAGQLLVASEAWSWTGGRPRRCLRSPGQWELAPVQAGRAPWKNALDVLEPVVREQAPGTRVHVTLSNGLVRYGLVPAGSGLHGRADQAYVRDCLGQLYGEAAANWEICTSPAPGGVRVASAIDAELAGELAAACANAGARLSSLRPLLSCVVNRWRGALRANSFWLVLAEPGVLCLALVERRRWQALRTVRAGDGWLEELAALLERETLLCTTQADADKVYLWAPQLDGEVPAQVGRWPVTRLSFVADEGAPSCAATWFGVGR